MNIKEAVDYDVRKMPFSRSAIWDYSDEVQEINKKLSDLTDEKKTYIDWVGNAFRELFPSSKYNITVSIDGKNVFIRGTSFSSDDIDHIRLLECDYHLDIFHDDCGNTICLMVELWD